MNKRNFLKMSSLLGGFSTLPALNVFGVSKSANNLNFDQVEALDAIEKYQKCLFIWPEQSGKTFVYNKVLDKHFGGADDSISIVSSGKGSLSVFDGLNNFHSQGLSPTEVAEIRLKSKDRRLVIFVTPDKGNNNWIMDNMHEFDYVDWRSYMSFQHQDYLFKDAAKLEKQESNDRLRKLHCGLVDTRDEDEDVDFDNPRLWHMMPDIPAWRNIYIKGDLV